MTDSCLQMLLTMAARRAGTPDDVDDLVQDVLVAALAQRRACDDPTFPAWASGVLRRRALFLARTAGRRRRREAAYATEATSAPAPARRLPRPFVESLPPSSRTVALLANAGLGRAEIASLLRISDTALRQRISALRRAWQRAGLPPDVLEIAAPATSMHGQRRRALRATLERLPEGRMAVADPDGHPLFLSGTAHIPHPRGN